jgi:hypothetical protein
MKAWQRLDVILRIITGGTVWHRSAIGEWSFNVNLDDNLMAVLRTVPCDRAPTVHTYYYGTVNTATNDGDGAQVLTDPVYVTGFRGLVCANQSLYTALSIWAGYQLLANADGAARVLSAHRIKSGRM